MEMKSEKGEVLAILNINSCQEEHDLDSVIQSLEPGMGKGIYMAEEKKITQQTNYEAVKWLKGLDELKAQLPLWEPVFPGNAEIMDIHAYYGFDNLTQEEIDEMSAESEATGKNVVRDLKPNDTLIGLNMIFRKGETRFEFRIFGTTKSRVHVSDIEQHTIDNLMIRANEAVYIGDSDKQQLIWAELGPKLGKALQYEILAEHSSREYLISIAESLQG
ncbi:hypothetical protein [Paenibacillus agri]|uniref:DUF4367 domain-containing protein n=1 Tax=Paenibacillus agri TaxID=2744309 RepID=A0A850EQY4_9BACL|nr:hypothetical protein [Paenibacillus agri]NUU63618.1 hypothetical protein [Paenibacillus agri]